MADEVQQAIQMIQLTGQGVAATARVTAVTGKIVFTLLKGAAALLAGLGKGTGKLIHGVHHHFDSSVSFRSINEYASKTGTTLIEEKIADRDVKAIRRELSRHGVEFSVYKDHNGEHRLFLKAANEATLRVALEKVISSHAKETEYAAKEQKGQESKSDHTAPQQSAPQQEQATKPQNGHPPFYNVSFEDALANPDIGMRRMLDSIRVTKECADSMNAGLERAHSGGNLRQYLDSLMQEYGSGRVQAVLARSVQFKTQDVRISADNKQYAEAHPVNYAVQDIQSDMTREYNLNVHPGILDHAVTEFRSMEQAREEPAHPPEASDISQQKPTEQSQPIRQPESPKATEAKTAEQSLPVSEQQPEVQLVPAQPSGTVEGTLFDGSFAVTDTRMLDGGSTVLLSTSFDERLTAATAKAQAANAMRTGQVAERASEAARSIPHKTPVLDR